MPCQPKPLIHSKIFFHRYDLKALLAKHRQRKHHRKLKLTVENFWWIASLKLQIFAQMLPLYDLKR